MAKRKYPSELNTKQIRVNLGDYALLAEISRRAGITMAEAVHIILEGSQMGKTSIKQRRGCDGHLY
jgi:hypothetical protein